MFPSKTSLLYPIPFRCSTPDYIQLFQCHIRSSIHPPNEMRRSREASTINSPDPPAFQILSIYPLIQLIFSTFPLTNFTFALLCYLLGVALLLVSLIYVIPRSRFRPCKGGPDPVNLQNLTFYHAGIQSNFRLEIWWFRGHFWSTFLKASLCGPWSQFFMKMLTSQIYIDFFNTKSRF